MQKSSSFDCRYVIEKCKDGHAGIHQVAVTVIIYYLEHSAIDPTCINHYTRTVSEWTKDNTVSFGLWDMTRRFRDCLGR